MSSRAGDIAALNRMHAFLEKQSDIWYPGRVIRFRQDALYHEFDAVLKERVAHASFVVEEMVGNAVFERNGQFLDITLWGKDRLTDTVLDMRSTVGEQRTLVDDLSGSRAFVLDERMYPCSVASAENGELRISIENAFASNPGDDEPELLLTRERLIAWVEGVLPKGDPESAVSMAVTYGGGGNSDSEQYTVSSFAPRTAIDVDAGCSAESRAFRWKEHGLMADASTGDSLDQGDVPAIVRDNGLTLPENAVYTGQWEEAPETGGRCRVVRFRHCIDDCTEAFAADSQQMSGDFPDNYESPGAVVIEDDYVLYYIDTGSRRVFSEDRRWRNIDEKIIVA